jgi:GNAT superfamily N-acetyltransferase
MTRFTPQARRIVDEFWAAETGCEPGDFDVESVALVVRPAADDSEYVHLLRCRQRLQITCSPALADAARRLVADQAADAVFDAGPLPSRLGLRVARIVGPAYLGYLDELDETCVSGPAYLLRDSLGELLSGLQATVSAHEWEYGGIEANQPVAGVVVNGDLVSAAGYEVWASRIAHVGVVTAPASRRRRFGTSCVGVVARQAHSQGLVAQFRTLCSNAGAFAVARSLGFVEYGATIYVAATSD